MTQSRPCSSLNLRHLERSSATVIPGVSSSKSFVFAMIPELSTTWSQSLSERFPVRSVWESTRDSMANRRFTNCSFDISREKIATVFLSFMVILCAKLSTNAVFPMDGRAAIKIRSDGCIPEVWRSKSVYPVERPVTMLWFRDAISILFTTFITTSRIGT